MAKFCTALLVLSCLAGLAQGQDCTVPGPDTIGIVFDQSNWHDMPYCVEFMGGSLAAYLVLFNPSCGSDIAGWDLRIDFDLPASDFLVGFDVPPVQCIYIVPPELPEITIGLCGSLPFQQVVRLATLNLLIFSPDPVLFHLGPTSSPLIPGAGAYVCDDDLATPVPMHSVFGDWEVPVAGINAGCQGGSICVEPIIGSETTSWGNVKSLYR